MKTCVALSSAIIAISAHSADADIFTCRAISDNLARLSCYDALASTDLNTKSDPVTAFEIYNDLISFSSTPLSTGERASWTTKRWENGEVYVSALHDYYKLTGNSWSQSSSVVFQMGLAREGAFFSNCHLHTFSQWAVHPQYMNGPEVNRGRKDEYMILYPLPENQIFVTFIVDIDLSMADPASTNQGQVQMVRGGEVILKSILSRGPLEEDGITFDSNGSYTVQNSIFEDLKRDRTISVALGSAHPEDSGEISNSLKNLVTICKK